MNAPTSTDGALPGTRLGAYDHARPALPISVVLNWTGTLAEKPD